MIKSNNNNKYESDNDNKNDMNEVDRDINYYHFLIKYEEINQKYENIIILLQGLGIGMGIALFALVSNI